MTALLLVMAATAVGCGAASLILNLRDHRAETAAAHRKGAHR